MIDTDDLMPVTYINSAADLKAFCGRHGGIVCTSSNARAVLEWSFARRKRVLFFPDQHLGRNTARAMGIPLDQMADLEPAAAARRHLDRGTIEGSRVLLWRGHCSVHQMFRPAHVDQFRQQHPGIKILVHPECIDVGRRQGRPGRLDRVHHQDGRRGPAGSTWAVGTELHLVNRLAKEHPGQDDPVPLADGLHVLDDVPHRPASPGLVPGEPASGHPGQPDQGARGNRPLARVALKRMLDVR